MYSQSSLLIVGALFLAILAAVWVGTRFGKWRAPSTSEQGRSQALAIQGSLLGLLALLLGFTFSLALGRHDDRSRAVVAEANAIGTAWLRADLLDEPARTGAREGLRAYVAERLAAAEVTVIERDERARHKAAATAHFDAVWALAAQEARAAGGPVPLAFAAALNDMIDAYGTRDAALDRHVPEIVVLLMFATLIFLGWVLGYTSRVSGLRPSGPLVTMILLIVTLVFLIIDLDRPRRGFITVNQAALIETGRTILGQPG